MKTCFLCGKKMVGRLSWLKSVGDVAACECYYTYYGDPFLVMTGKSMYNEWDDGVLLVGMKVEHKKRRKSMRKSVGIALVLMALVSGGCVALDMLVDDFYDNVTTLPDGSVVVDDDPTPDDPPTPDIGNPATDQSKKPEWWQAYGAPDTLVEGVSHTVVWKGCWTFAYRGWGSGLYKPYEYREDGSIARRNHLWLVGKGVKPSAVAWAAEYEKDKWVRWLTWGLGVGNNSSRAIDGKHPKPDNSLKGFYHNGSLIIRGAHAAKSGNKFVLQLKDGTMLVKKIVDPECRQEE